MQAFITRMLWKPHSPFEYQNLKTFNTTQIRLEVGLDGLSSLRNHRVSHHKIGQDSTVGSHEELRRHYKCFEKHGFQRRME